MTASFGLHETVAAHGVQIQNVERRTDAIEKKLDRIFWSVITTLGSVLGAVLMLYLKH